MKKPYSKTFTINVTSSGEQIKKTFEVDKSVINAQAVALTSSREELLYYRGSFKLEINKDEIFSEDTSAKKIYALPSVDANNRSYRIGTIPIGNGLINFNYKDTDDGRTAFTPYSVQLIIDGERESEV
jgi:hypothetical protein